MGRRRYTLKLAGLCSLLCSLNLFASDKIKADVSSDYVKDTLTVQFKMQTGKDLKLNMNAPWRLKLGTNTLFDKTTYSKTDFDQKVPGFVLKSKKKVLKDTSVSYE